MSTNRYLNAGAPGAGTTIDNMNSRIKVWSNVNQTGVQSVRASFNVSSITDASVGVTNNNLTNPMASTNNGLSTSFGNQGSNYDRLSGGWDTVSIMSFAGWNAAGTLTDFSLAYGSGQGSLA